MDSILFTWEIWTHTTMDMQAKPKCVNRCSDNKLHLSGCKNFSNRTQRKTKYQEKCTSNLQRPAVGLGHTSSQWKSQGSHYTPFPRDTLPAWLQITNAIASLVMH